VGETLTDLRIGPGPGKDPLSQGVQIETGATAKKPGLIGGDLRSQRL